MAVFETNDEINETVDEDFSLDFSSDKNEDNTAQKLEEELIEVKKETESKALKSSEDEGSVEGFEDINVAVTADNTNEIPPEPTPPVAVRKKRTGIPKPSQALTELRDEIQDELDELSAGVPDCVKDVQLEDNIYDNTGKPKEDVIDVGKEKRNKINNGMKEIRFRDNEERDSYIMNTNKQVMEMRQELKKIAQWQMGQKHNNREQEKRIKIFEEERAKYSEMMDKITSHRRYSDLSDVDFEEVKRRVIEEITNKVKPTETEIIRTTTPKKIKKKWKFSWMYLVVTIAVFFLFFGYYWKTTSKIVVNPNNIRTVVLPIKASIICEGINDDLMINPNKLKGYFKKERFFFKTKILGKNRLCNISKDILQ